MSPTEVRDLLRTLSRREEGQTMAEYGVVLAVLTIGVVGLFTALSGAVTATIARAIGLLPS
jgi:Flp pilus assembly pilin Flp